VSDAWEIGVRLENLFDRRYRLHGSGIDASGHNLFVSVLRTW